jgi:hypothetical protein
MEEIIKNRVALELKRQEEFPTLGAVNKSKYAFMQTMETRRALFKKFKNNINSSDETNSFLHQAEFLKSIIMTRKMDLISIVYTQSITILGLMKIYAS